MTLDFASLLLAPIWAVSAVAVFVGCVIAWRRSGHYSTIMMVIGSFLSLMSIAQQYAATLLVDQFGFRVLALLGGFTLLGNLLFGIGFIILMLGQRSPRTAQSSTGQLWK